MNPIPDSTRFLIAQVVHIQDTEVGETVLLPHGALLSYSGFPVLLPELLATPSPVPPSQDM